MRVGIVATLSFNILAFQIWECPLVEAQTDEGTTVTLFSQDFVREKGKPRTEEVTFSVPPSVEGPFTLVVENASPEIQRIPFVSVKVNGDRVVKRIDFFFEWLKRWKRGDRNPPRSIEREVVLFPENTLEVVLRGKPGASIRVSVTGQTPPDTTSDEITENVDEDGDTVVLPSLATLVIPEGAAVASTVTVSAVSSPFMDFLGQDLMPIVTLLADVPKIRIKSSQSFLEPVRLLVAVPGLQSIIPAGSRPVFLSVIRQGGENDEQIDTLDPIGGVLCDGGDAACVSIVPEHFLPINPNDPDDPVIQLALGFENVSVDRSLNLWDVFVIEPVGDQTKSPDDTLFVTATFALEKDFDFVPFSPLLTNVVTRGGAFGAPRGAGDEPHRGIDLRTKNLDPRGEQAVFAVLPGTVNPEDRAQFSKGGQLFCGGVPIAGRSRGYGHNVRILHDGLRADSLRSRYAHLLGGTLLPPGAFVSATAGVPIAVSDSSGGVCPPGPGGAHLHFEVWFDGKRIDPEPLLRNDMSLYLRNTKTTLRLLIGNDIVQPVERITDTSRRFFSREIPLSSFPPRSRPYTMSLELCSFRLGNCSVLHSWNITVEKLPLLKVNKSGPGSVTSVSPPGMAISCDPDCEASFPKNTKVTLEAAPDSGDSNDFQGFSCSNGASTGPGETTITFDLSEDTTCDATFDKEFRGTCSATHVFGPFPLQGCVRGEAQAFFFVDVHQKDTPVSTETSVFMRVGRDAQFPIDIFEMVDLHSVPGDLQFTCSTKKVGCLGFDRVPVCASWFNSDTVPDTMSLRFLLFDRVLGNGANLYTPPVDLLIPTCFQ